MGIINHFRDDFSYAADKVTASDEALLEKYEQTQRLIKKMKAMHEVIKELQQFIEDAHEVYPNLDHDIQVHKGLV